MRPTDTTMSAPGDTVVTESQPSAAEIQGKSAPPGAGGPDSPVSQNVPYQTGSHQQEGLSPITGLNDSLLDALSSEVCPESAPEFTSPVRNTPSRSTFGQWAQAQSPVPLTMGDYIPPGAAIPLQPPPGGPSPARHGVQAPPLDPDSYSASNTPRGNMPKSPPGNIGKTGGHRADGLQGPPSKAPCNIAASSKAPPGSSKAPPGSSKAQPVIVPVRPQEQHPNAQDWHRHSGINLGDVRNNVLNERQEARWGDPQGYTAHWVSAHAPGRDPPGTDTGFQSHSDTAAGQVPIYRPGINPATGEQLPTDLSHTYPTFPVTGDGLRRAYGPANTSNRPAVATPNWDWQTGQPKPSGPVIPASVWRPEHWITPNTAPEQQGLQDAHLRNPDGFIERTPFTWKQLRILHRGLIDNLHAQEGELCVGLAWHRNYDGTFWGMQENAPNGPAVRTLPATRRQFVPWTSVLEVPLQNMRLLPLRDLDAVRHDDAMLKQAFVYIKDEHRNTYEAYRPTHSYDPLFTWQISGAEHAGLYSDVRLPPLAWNQPNPGTIPPTRLPSREPSMDIDTEHRGKRDQPEASGIEEPPRKRTPCITPRDTPRGSVVGPLATASVSYSTQAQGVAPAQGLTTSAQVVQSEAHASPVIPVLSAVQSGLPVPLQQPQTLGPQSNVPLPAAPFGQAEALAHALQENQRLQEQVQGMQAQADTYIQQQVRDERGKMQEHCQHQLDAREAQFQAAAGQYQQRTADDLAVSEAQRKQREDHRIAQIQKQAEATQRSAAKIQEQRVEQVSSAAQAQIAEMQNAGATVTQQLQQAQHQATASAARAVESESFAQSLLDTNLGLTQEIDHQNMVSAQMLSKEKAAAQAAEHQSQVDRKNMEQMQQQILQLQQNQALEITRIQDEAQKKIADKECEAQSHQARMLLLERTTLELQHEVARVKHFGPNRATIGGTTTQTFSLQSPRAQSERTSGGTSSGTSDAEVSEGENQPPSAASTESYDEERCHENLRKVQEGVNFIPDRVPLERNPDDPEDIGQWNWLSVGASRTNGKPHLLRACCVCGEMHKNLVNNYCSPQCMEHKRQAQMNDEIIKAFPDSAEAKAARAAGSQETSGGVPPPPAPHSPPETPVLNVTAADEPDADNSHVSLDPASKLLQKMVESFTAMADKMQGKSDEEKSPYKPTLPDKLSIASGPGTRNKKNWQTTTWRYIAEASGMPKECCVWLDAILHATHVDDVHGPGKFWQQLDLLIKKTMWPHMSAKQKDEINLKEKEERHKNGGDSYSVSGRQLLYILLRDKERNEDEITLENRNILLGHKFGKDARKSQHNYYVKKMDVSPEDLAEKTYRSLLTSRYEDWIKGVDGFQLQYQFLIREAWQTNTKLTLEKMEEEFDSWLDHCEKQRIIQEGRANWNTGEEKGQKAMGFTATGEGKGGLKPGPRDCWRHKGKGCSKGNSCPYDHREEMRGIKCRPRSKSVDKGRPSRSRGGKGQTKGRLINVKITGKGKGKGKKPGGYAIGYPKSAKGLGRAPAPKKLGTAPDGTQNQEKCRNYYTKAGCPFTGKNGTKKCHYWHPGYCYKWAQGTCPFADDKCTFLHKPKPGKSAPAEGAQGRPALSAEEKKKKNAEKKAAKKLKKEQEKAAAPAAQKNAAAKPKPKAKAKGKAQHRLATAGPPEPGEYQAGHIWEDDTHVYMWVDPDMQYDQDYWFQDADGEWWADCVMEDDGYDEWSPWGQ